MIHLAHNNTMKNGSDKRLRSRSNTLTSLSCGSDSLTLNIEPTVFDGLISSSPSLLVIATNFDEKYILGMNKKITPQVNKTTPL